MARGPVKEKYPAQFASLAKYPVLATILMVLDAGPLELSRHNEALSFHTAHGILRRGKSASLTTALKITAALRAYAKARADQGLSSIPPEAISAESLFQPPGRDAACPSVNIIPATHKSKAAKRDLPC